jgi:putative nucleotidyltransferase with HDIG domain
VKTPPRLIARTLAVTLATVTIILGLVFVVLTIDARARVLAAETDKLHVSQRVFEAQEAERHVERLALVAALAEQPRIKAALDIYLTESAFGDVPTDREDRLRTVAQEIDKVARTLRTSTVVLLDLQGRVFAASGSARDRWPIGQVVDNLGDVALAPTGEAFRITGAPLQLDGDRDVGTMIVATSLDADYAATLSGVLVAGIVIARGPTVIASTVPAEVARELLATGASSDATHALQGEEFAVKQLFASGPIRILSLNSIDAAARTATRDALIALGTIAFGSFVLAALGSLWLARTLANPIEKLSSEIGTMTATHAFWRTLKLTGSSRELDALATAFNDLMRGLMNAQGETRAAYIGAIRALAAALDARDPYTAGHSERVSAYSVLIARELQLPESDVDVIRLGALLHDIGKIGVDDTVLRKPAPLTAEEFEQIKRHPGLGARILRQVPFLAPHIPIVELHHERPDGQGYPFGLRGDDIPIAARIVHVADAFDAMTSARAYRPARPASIALEELRRCAGTDFDTECVDAIGNVLPRASAIQEPHLQELLGRGV